MHTVRLERGAQRSQVQPGARLQDAVPVVVMGELEPDDRSALKDGVGSRLRAQEGFFGAAFDVNPDPFVSLETVVTTDGSGNGTGTLGTATPARRYRVISTWWRGTADAGGTIAVGSVSHCTDVAGPDPKPCNFTGGDGATVNITIAAAAASSSYVVGATLRREDLEVVV